MHPLGEKIQTHTIAFEFAKRKCSWMLMVQTCNFSRWEVKEFKGIHLWLQERGRMLREKKYWGAEEGCFLKGIPRCFQEIPWVYLGLTCLAADPESSLSQCLGPTPCHASSLSGVYFVHVNEPLRYHWLTGQRGRACRCSRKLKRPGVC